MEAPKNNPESPNKSPKIEQEPVTGALEVEGYQLGQNVLGAILGTDARLLWRFRKRDGLITAQAYSESEVIWIDKEPADDSVSPFGPNRDPVPPSD